MALMCMSNYRYCNNNCHVCKTSRPSVIYWSFKSNGTCNSDIMHCSNHRQWTRSVRGWLFRPILVVNGFSEDLKHVEFVLDNMQWLIINKLWKPLCLLCWTKKGPECRLPKAWSLLLFLTICSLVSHQSEKKVQLTFIVGPTR